MTFTYTCIAVLVLLAGGIAGCSSRAVSPDAAPRSGTGGGHTDGGGQGGASGSAGTGGAGGIGTGGAAGEQGIDAAACQAHDASPDGAGTATGQFTLVYDGTVKSCLTTCIGCTGVYDLGGYAPLNLPFDNGAGGNHMTLVDLTVEPGVQGAMYAVTLEVLENNPPLGSAYQGVFSFPNGMGAINVGPGACVTFSRLDMENGGGVAGAVDCDLMGKGVNNDQVVLHITGTFSSLFP